MSMHRGEKGRKIKNPRETLADKSRLMISPGLLSRRVPENWRLLSVQSLNPEEIHLESSQDIKSEP